MSETQVTVGSIQAVLLDLDGTLYVEGKWLPGAVDTVRWLMAQGLGVRFITNTTMRNRGQLQHRFRQVGLDVPQDWFFTPARAAYRWFQQQDTGRGILALVHPDLLHDLQGLPLRAEEPADFVLVGDMGDAWDVGVMNRALRALLGGARLTALQRNRYWRAQDGYRLDAGAFVAALEYAAQVTCDPVFGKPNPIFFEMVLLDVGVPPEEAVMVGDDLESDVLGAQACGIRGVLVRTGKFRPQVLTQAQGKPDAVLEDVNHLRTWLST